MDLLERFDFHLSPRAQKWMIGGAALTVGGLALGATAAALAASALLRSRRGFSLAGKVVFITGGSRGLGLAMAEEFARRGAKIAICARDAEELVRARQCIERETQGTVSTFVCDVSNRAQVENTVREVQDHFGTIDILINNAGVISVGPIENQKLADFEEAMQVNFWSQVYATLAVLPEMRRRREAARIVNITSIGGKVSVPHLLPYSCSKFAAVAFSEGLRAELAHTGVKVVTVAPGLMRTGSHINADFKGKHSQEFTWFSLSGTNPMTSISVSRAAKQIADATVSGQAELIITWQAELLARIHGIAPGLTTELLSLVSRTLPSAGESDEKRKGRDSENAVTKSPLTALGQMAARRYNQTPA